MSEKLPITAERQEALLPSPEQHKALPDPEHAEPLRPGEKGPAGLQEARQQVEEITSSEPQPNPLERSGTAEDNAQAAHAAYVDQELRQISLRRELQHIQRNLPATSRAFSKFTHQPAIRAISNAASGSLARPSGMFGGGLLALLGTSGYLYYARHLGFTYNYFVFFLLFVAGFAVGILLELAVQAALAIRRR